MPKISLDNLERYDGHLKDWCDARFAEKKVHENWHEAGPSGAVSFYPVPNRPIDPVVNFAFTETLPEGTKGHDNPSTITGVSSVKVTRCGKNLIPYPYLQSSFANHGYTATSNNDGSVTFNGESNGLGACHFNLVSTGTFLVKGGVSYTAALYGAVNIGVVFQAWGSNGRFVFSVWSGGQPATITLNEDAYITMRVTATQTAGSLTNAVFRPQLELGSIATSFEPYSGADYTVNLGGTYYGGSVDLSAGTMTVTWEGIRVGDYSSVLTYRTDRQCWQIYASPAGNYQPTVFPVCTHSIFDQSPVFDSATDGYFRWTAGSNSTVWWFKSTATTAEEFLSIYADALIVYEVKNPYTVQLTPTQIYSLSQLDPYNPRINTVYSDQQSVLVRYPKSPIVSGSELDDAILSLGGD